MGPLPLAGQSLRDFKTMPLKKLSLVEIFKSWFPPESLCIGQATLTLSCWEYGVGLSPLPTHLSLSRSVSTELRRWRLTCVTRARMSLPGKVPAPSLHGEPLC